MKGRDHRNYQGVEVPDSNRMKANLMISKTSKAKSKLKSGKVVKNHNHNPIKMTIMAKITTIVKNTIMDRNKHHTRKAGQTRDSNSLRKPFMRNDLPKDSSTKCFPNKIAGKRVLPLHLINLFIMMIISIKNIMRSNQRGSTVKSTKCFPNKTAGKRALQLHHIALFIMMIISLKKLKKNLRR